VCNNEVIQEQETVTFQIFPFLFSNISKYSALFAFFAIEILNKPEPIFIFLRLFTLALAVIFLLILIIQAAQYRSRLSPTDISSRGEITLFCIFNILVIICLVYNEIKPDPNGITTLPSFLLCLGYIGFLKLLTSEGITDKSSLVAAIMIVFVLSTEVFLYTYASTQYFVQIAIDPVVYYWLVVGLLSISFTFFGGILAYLSMFFVHYPTAVNIQYYTFLIEENASERSIILQLAAGITLLFTIYITPLFFHLLFIL
jgi:hypothetical protein